MVLSAPEMADPCHGVHPLPSSAIEGLDRTWRVSACLAPLAAVVPLLLQHRYAQLRPGRPLRLFELLAMCAALVLVGAAALTIRRLRPRGVALLPLAGFVIVVMTASQLFVHELSPTWDFQSYRRGGEAMLSGQTPYRLVNPDYLYPPPFGQALALSAKAMDWSTVFYLFQVLQLCAVATAYVLLFKAAMRLGLSSTAAALLVTLLLVVNVPLTLTIQLDQVNVLLLVLVLSAVALEGQVDALAGLALAASGIIKLYPFALLPVWWLHGRRRAVLWAAGWAAAIVAISRPWHLWADFVRFWMRPPAYPRAGDSSAFNVFANGGRFLGFFSSDQPPGPVRTVWLAIVLLIAVWATRRIVTRWRLEPDLFACTAETLAITLLISPLVWPHHFVYALPLVVYAAARAGERGRILVGVGAVLIFAVPWFDVFLLSYHRLAGLCLVLYACRPGRNIAD